MIIRRLKANFTSGELSPLIDARVDNDRYRNGCKTLKNMHVKVQGPAVRRSGFQFIYDISSLSIDDSVLPRLVPFIFDEDNAYVLVFYKHTTGTTRVVFATDEGLVEDPGVPGDPYAFEFTGTMDIETFQYAQSADILFITQPDRLPVEFKRLAHDSWSANEVSITTPPFVLNTTAITITPSGTTGSITLTASAALFTTAYVGQQMQVNGGTVLISAFTSSTVVSATTIVDLGSTTATAEWYSQEWSAAFGYPRFVGFYEQRLFYSSNLTRPQTIWFSKSGDYYDFSVSSPIVASDAATFTLDSGSQNKMQWVMPSRQLIIGTLGDEWSISGSGYEPLSFQSIEAARNTNHGGEDLAPLMIGPVVLFLERLGRTVNQIVYDYNSDSYTTVDLSVLAPHLTEDYTIRAWDYQQTPSGIVWAVREDGTLLGLTFKREHNVTGWHRHDTQGEFIDVACIPGDNEDELWTLVSRTVEEDSLIYLEKKAPEFSGPDVLAGRFLDSFLTYSGTETTTISGLDHLEGLSVGVLGDGFVFSNVTVDGGEIELPQGVSEAVVGLEYTSELVPQLPETDMNDMGATFDRTRRSTHIVVHLYKSLGMTFGRYDSERGEIGTEDVPFRTPGMDVEDAVPLFSGVRRLKFPQGHDRISDIFIRQTQPLPLTVISIVDEVSFTR